MQHFEGKIREFSFIENGEGPICSGEVLLLPSLYTIIEIASDTALKKLEHDVNLHLLSAKQLEIVLIEFARNDYRRAFRQFNDAFLHDAYFLYLDVETDICKRRIQERIASRSSEDDFYVSEYIFSTYYNRDDGRFIPQILASDHGIGKERVIVIDNNGSLSDSIAQVYQFVDTMCDLETLQDS